MKCKNSMYAVITSFVFLCSMAGKSNAQSDKRNVEQQDPNFNSLTRQEKENGWKLLFDGKTLNGWNGVNPSGDPYKNWSINNGVLSPKLLNKKVDRDIITKEQFDNFELSLEFKIFKRTNSGIKYFVKNNYSKNTEAYLGLEYQIVDTANVKYSQRGRFRTIASLYDMIPSDNDKNFNPLGEWNRAKIVSKGGHVEHWLNGKKVLEYERGSDTFKTLINRSKYKIYEHFGEADEGHILLQNEGTLVSFRNIKIKSSP